MLMDPQVRAGERDIGRGRELLRLEQALGTKSGDVLGVASMDIKGYLMA